jgi:hypothetical protein
LQFTRCVRAYSEAEALAAMRAAYRPQATPGSGRRTSYTVSSAVSSICDQSSEDGAEVSSSSGSDGSGSSESAGGGPSAGEDSAKAIEPFADPLDIDSSFGGEEGSSSEIGDLDFESIPASDEFQGEMPEGEIDSIEAPSE